MSLGCLDFIMVSLVRDLFIIYGVKVTEGQTLDTSIRVYCNVNDKGTIKFKMFDSVVWYEYS